MTARNFANQSTAAVLTNAVVAADAVIVVSNYTGFPTPPYTAVIENNLPGQEVVLVTAVAGANLTVTRGYDGTTAQAHAAATVLQHVVTALDAREANVHVNATGATHGLAAGVNFLGDTSVQTVTNKTIRTSTLEVNSAGGTAALASATAGTTGFLFRGSAAGVDKFTVTETGAVATPAAISAASVAVTTATVTGNETVGGTLGVTGASTLADVTAASLTVTGNTTHTGTLTQTGAATVGGALTVGGPVLAQGTLGANGATTLATTSTGALTAQSATVSGALSVVGATTLAAATTAALTSTTGAFSGAITGPTITALGRGVLTYAKRTTDLTPSTSPLTDATLISSVTMPAGLGSRIIFVQVEAELLSSVAGASYISIYRNGLEHRTVGMGTAGGNSTIPCALSAQFTEIASAGVTYQVRVSGSGQGIYATSTRFAFIRVTDVAGV